MVIVASFNFSELLPSAHDYGETVTLFQVYAYGSIWKYSILLDYAYCCTSRFRFLLFSLCLSFVIGQDGRAHIHSVTAYCCQCRCYRTSQPQQGFIFVCLRKVLAEAW